MHGVLRFFHVRLCVREGVSEMAFRDGYLSELVGRPAMLSAGGSVGKVVDFYVGKPDDTFPRIDGVVIKTRAGERVAPLSDVLEYNPQSGLVLRATPEQVALPDERAFYLIKDLFDKQIVDVDGRKVVRINDLEVANTGGTLRVVAADIG